MGPLIFGHSTTACQPGGLSALAGVLSPLFRQEREGRRKDRQQFGAVAQNLADEIKKLSEARNSRDDGHGC